MSFIATDDKKLAKASRKLTVDEFFGRVEMVRRGSKLPQKPDEHKKVYIEDLPKFLAQLGKRVNVKIIGATVTEDQIVKGANDEA